MLTNSAQWGWDFARDSWWPVQEWPASHLRGTAPKTRKVDQYFLPASPLPFRPSCECVGHKTYIETMPLLDSK